VCGEFVSSQSRQLVASLLVAVLIVVLTIVTVNARLGDSGDLRERDYREENDDNSGKGSHRTILFKSEYA
jgi:hypothetical protein